MAGGARRCAAGTRHVAQPDRASLSEGEGCRFESRRDDQIRMVNRPGGRRGFENRWCRRLRPWRYGLRVRPPSAKCERNGRSTGREAGIRRKRIGCASIADQDRGLPPGKVIGRPLIPVRSEMGGASHWGSTRRLSAILRRPRTYRRHASQMRSLAIFSREVRDPGSLISCSRRIRLPPLQPNPGRLGTGEPNAL